MARAESRTRAPAARAVTPALLRQHALPPISRQADKEERGRVLVVGGGRSTPGAVRLAGEAALRAGAGKLQIATVASVAPLLGIAVPEALVIGLRETRGGEIHRRGHAALIGRVQSADAVLIGPGILDRAEAARLVASLALKPGAVLVLDAGALSACAHVAKDGGFPTPTLLTPHGGELREIADELDIDPDGDTERVALEVAARCRAWCLAKGPTTWIAAPDGRLFKHACEVPGLATSGSGDVLAGVVAGLAARSGDALTAALWAVTAHTAAGKSLAKTARSVGFLARELADRITLYVG